MVRVVVARESHGVVCEIHMVVREGVTCSS